MFRVIVMFAAVLLTAPAMADVACHEGSATAEIAAMSVPGMPDEIADTIGDRTAAQLAELVEAYGPRSVEKAKDRRRAQLLIRLNQEYSKLVTAAGFYCPCGRAGQNKRMTVYGQARQVTCTTQEAAGKLVYVVILSGKHTIVVPPHGARPVVADRPSPTSPTTD